MGLICKSNLPLYIPDQPEDVLQGEPGNADGLNEAKSLVILHKMPMVPKPQQLREGVL